MALFNQTQTDQAVEFSAGDVRQTLTLKPGINFTSLPLTRPTGAALIVTLRQKGKTIDSQEVPLEREPLAWLSQRTLAVELKGSETPLTLPADASAKSKVFVAASRCLHWL